MLTLDQGRLSTRPRHRAEPEAAIETDGSDVASLQLRALREGPF